MIGFFSNTLDERQNVGYAGKDKGVSWYEGVPFIEIESMFRVVEAGSHVLSASFENDLVKLWRDAQLACNFDLYIEGDRVLSMSFVNGGVRRVPPGFEQAGRQTQAVGQVTLEPGMYKLKQSFTCDGTALEKVRSFGGDIGFLLRFREPSSPRWSNLTERLYYIDKKGEV